MRLFAQKLKNRLLPPLAILLFIAGDVPHEMLKPFVEVNDRVGIFIHALLEKMKPLGVDAHPITRSGDSRCHSVGRR